jgi:uncharacterized protein YxjI
MESLQPYDALIVSQQKEWGEIFTGFEQRNKYLVQAPTGEVLYAAVETGGSTLFRLVLKALRPFTIQIFTPDRKPVLTLERPFRFYFHKLEVRDPEGGLVGSIEKQFTWLRRKYIVTNAAGQEVLQLYGPLFHPWTFNVLGGGETLGQITKKWSGLLKEGFTDADQFGVAFEPTIDVNLKALLLGAVFLIDFVHFENTGNN